MLASSPLEFNLKSFKVSFIFYYFNKGLLKTKIEKRELNFNFFLLF